MSCDLGPVEEKYNFGYQSEKEQGFSEPASLARRPKGSKLSEAMRREPESKGFLGKAAFEKRDPAERLGFFVDRKIEAQAIHKGKKRGEVLGFMKCFLNTSLYPVRNNAQMLLAAFETLNTSSVRDFCIHGVTPFTPLPNQ